jgi:YD repeat-containing protein
VAAQVERPLTRPRFQIDGVHYTLEVAGINGVAGNGGRGEAGHLGFVDPAPLPGGNFERPHLAIGSRHHGRAIGQGGTTHHAAGDVLAPFFLAVRQVEGRDEALGLLGNGLGIVTDAAAGKDDGVPQDGGPAQRLSRSGVFHWTNIRQVVYAYYEDEEAHGNVGDLKTATIQDGSDNDLATTYYRYYTAAEEDGYQHGLKYLFTPESYARLVADLGDPEAEDDGTVAPYADNYFEYDSDHRVTLEIAQSAGCSACSAGLGSFTFSYTTSEHEDGFNSWKVKTVETLPDDNQNIVYTNAFGQVMAKIFYDTTSEQKWISFYRYDEDGRLILEAAPSAVSGYNDTYADLLHESSGNLGFLRDDEGLITIYSYSASTTASTSSAGAVEGYLEEVSLQRGELGDEAPQSTMQYIARTVSSKTIFLSASTTVYTNDDGTGGLTTGLEYTFTSGSFQVAALTITAPTVTTSQNGPNTASEVTVVFDAQDRPTWTLDAAGFVHYTAYDPTTGAVLKTITDVDTEQDEDFADLPSGWETPVGGGLHLITTYEVDTLGRPTKTVDPNGNVTYTFYNDPAKEVRIYAGWNTTTDSATGPTWVMRQDWANRYAEVLTMSAAPNLTDDRPDGTEAIDDVQTLSRSLQSTAGQTIGSNGYFHLDGLTYSTTVSLGTEGTDYYHSSYAYDKRGRPSKTVTATGTIYRTVYDGLGRPVSEWVGTDDDPVTGYWSPTNPAEMTKVREYIYDNDAIGDGNLTSMLVYPGGSGPVRQTDFFYDWRNRLVAQKAGVEETEDTDTNRPISFFIYNNLGQVLTTESYDGDDVTIIDDDADGVPDRPESELLRAKSSAEYDNLGRVFRTHVYSVNPANGNVSTSSLTSDVWYDARGLLVKTASPGGLVQKTQYDGAGRAIITFTTDGGADGDYADAFDVVDDAVLEQGEYAYDPNGNVIQVTLRQRFHDETDTGALGDADSGVLARVSFAGMYYDPLNRLTDQVNVGTNSAEAWTRPEEVPTRSDTALVTSYTYNLAGWTEDVIDPAGIVSRTLYDNLGRTIITIANYTNGTPTSNTNKTTAYTYDGLGQMLTLTAVLPEEDVQTTEWIYGVFGLQAVWQPDKATGAASDDEEDTYTLNNLGQRTTFTDRNGTTHA